jgi:hypothetical protein
VGNGGGSKSKTVKSYGKEVLETEKAKGAEK